MVEGRSALQKVGRYKGGAGKGLRRVALRRVALRRVALRRVALRSFTSFYDHFKSFNDKMPLKENLHNLCLLEQNNYFIDQPLNTLDHVDVNIRPIKQVSSSFRSSNKWPCLMNQKLNLFWKKIDQKVFKNQLEKFTSIENAFGAATKLNRDHNPEYKSNKSTSLDLKIRKRTPISTEQAGTSASNTSNQPNSSSTEKEQTKLDFQKILNRYKDQARLEIAEHIDELQQVCKMTKLNLFNNISQKNGSNSLEWLAELLGYKAT